MQIKNFNLLIRFFKFTQWKQYYSDIRHWVDQLQVKADLSIDIDMARRYAYLFFFRAMIPLDDLIEETTFGQLRLKLDKHDDLKTGHSPALDVICDAILTGKPFINPYT